MDNSGSVLRYNLVPLLADILIDTEKEKVVRMCIATFRVRATIQYHLPMS